MQIDMVRIQTDAADTDGSSVRSLGDRLSDGYWRAFLLVLKMTIGAACGLAIAAFIELAILFFR